MTILTFDPTTVSANITLSGGNLTATQSGSGQSAAFSNYAMVSGLYYFEFTINSAPSINTMCGVSQITTTTVELAGSGGNYFAVYKYSNGDCFVGSTGSPIFTSIGAFTSGIVVGVALDLTDNRAWLKVGTGFWNGNSSATPTSATTGYDISGMVGTNGLCAIASFNSTSGDSITANFGATSYTYSMPTGYVTPNSATTPALKLIASSGSGSGTITGVNAVGSVGTVSGSTTKHGTATGVVATGSVGMVSGLAASNTIVEASQLTTEVIGSDPTKNVAATQMLAEVIYVVTSTTLAEAAQVTTEIIAENPILQSRPVQVIVEVLSLPPTSLHMTHLSCVVPFDNHVSLRHSDTRGATWSNANKQTLGNQGEFDVDVSFRRLGMSRDRVWEISWAGNMPTALLGAFVQFDICSS